MFSLCWLVIWRSGSKRFKFSRPCWLKKEHILAIDQLFYRFLSSIFQLSISIVSEVFRMPFINSTSSRCCIMRVTGEAHEYACQTGSKCRRVIFVYRVAMFLSKLHYIYPKCNIYVQNCDMYIQIRRPVFVLYITVKWFYIFQYSFDINISRTFLDIYFMRSVFHVSLHDLSRISRAWHRGRHVSFSQNSNTAAEERRIQRIVREIVSSEIGEPNLPTYVQIYQSNREAPVNTGGGFQNVNEELRCRFQIPRRFPANGDRECALSPLLAPKAERQASQQQIASSFNPSFNYGGRMNRRRPRRQGTLPYSHGGSTSCSRDAGQAM